MAAALLEEDDPATPDIVLMNLYREWSGPRKRGETIIISSRSSMKNCTTLLLTASYEQTDWLSSAVKKWWGRDGCPELASFTVRLVAMPLRVRVRGDARQR